MTVNLRALIRVASLASVICASATAALAQTTYRVTSGQATIWNADFRSPAATVRAGTFLSVVGRREDWYEVIVPDSSRTDQRTGFIFKSNVEPVPFGAATSAPPVPSQTLAPASVDESRGTSVVAFGEFGYTRFAAHQSFSAVLGEPGGLSFGGGVEMRTRAGWFINGSAERFSRTGQRAVVIDGDVFRLGTPDTIAITPVAVKTGWLFWRDRAMTPYVGGGIGTVFYRENSKFGEASDNVSRRFTSYHALGGVEFRNEWLGTAFEVEYSRVPNAIGAEGVSAAFHESNLGGIVGRIKVLVGR